MIVERRDLTARPDRVGAVRLNRDIKPRSTLFCAADQHSIGRALNLADRVMIVGPLPTVDTIDGPGRQPWTRGGDYAEAERARIQRWHNAGQNRTVELLGAGDWFRDADSHVDAWAAWMIVQTMIDTKWPGAVMMTTPGITGRDLWLRSIPTGHRYVPPPAEVVDMIHATSGQGRTEMLTSVVDGPLPRLREWDARRAYMGLMRELPGNFVDWVVSNSPTDRADMIESLHDRARYEITVTVPTDWTHVGIAPLWNPSARRWIYPAEPGQRFRTWVDGNELALIHRHWEPFSVNAVHQRIRFATGRPLDNLGAALQTMIDQLEKTHVGLGFEREYSAAAVRHAVDGLRAIALHTIGALYGRPPAVTVRTPITAGRPTTGSGHRIDGVEWVRTEHVEHRSPWAIQPQMSAAIWARMRCRLLDSPGGAGALHLNRRDLVAFRTDAIYHTSDGPCWPDDGRAGRFRERLHLAGPLARPLTQTELLTIRNGAF